MSLKVTLSPLSCAETLRRDWQELEGRGNGSFFLSWHWIGSLVALSPRSHHVLDVHYGSLRVGLALVSITISAPYFRRRRLATLNETGDTRYDAVYIEYNGVLSDRRYEFEATLAAIECLTEEARTFSEPFEAIRLGGVDPRYLSLLTSLGWRVTVEDRKPCFGIDLDSIRRTARSFTQALSRNTRHQIRRSLRAYGQFGDVTCRTARDETEARDDFAGLIALHQAAWRNRGRDGAFGNPCVVGFHAKLIESGFRDGAVELVRVSAGDRIIGYLYNFIYRNRVYFYQSGLRYEKSGHFRPGLVSHSLCIEDHLRRGSQFYDFMAGDHRYKMQLGARGSDLLWLYARRSTTARIRDSSHGS